MAAFDPTPPSFNIPAQIPTRDIGAGYAAGITQAGKSLSEATAGVMDVMTRNRNADDMLNALHQTKVLSSDQYNAIANKGLGAKEALTGMYANQWMLDQANQRAQSLQAGRGGVEVAVEHAKMLDLLNMYKSGGPGLDQSKVPWHPPAQQQQAPPPQPPVVPSPQAIAAAQQQAGQYAGGSQVGGAPPTSRVGPLPGSKRVQQVDSVTGKTLKGWQYPGGTFVADQGQ